MNQETSPAAPKPASSARRIAVIGLGEVGRSYGRALSQQGHRVLGYDPFNPAPLEGVTVCETVEEVTSDVDVVFVLTAAGASHKVADDLAPSLPDGVVYADFTSSAPAAKLALGDRLAGVRGVQLVDVAILGPVVKLGATTPLMVAGPGSGVVAEIMRPLGASVEAVEGAVGSAMAHKLLRSVFMKGLAATVVEALEAGRAAGFESWIREQIARELAGDGQATIDRFESGSRLHADRRASEMDAAAGYLEVLGATNTMTRAAAARHRELVARGGTDSAA